MAVRVVNRWCGPMVVDFGPPLGAVRIPAAGTVLDVDFNDLGLPAKTLSILRRKTIELIDLDALADEEAEAKAKVEAEAKAKATKKT